MLTIKYLGHSGFEIDIAGKRIYIDLFLLDKPVHGQRKIQAAITAEDIKSADVVFVTHEHDTHCEKETIEKVVEKTGASVVAPRPALAKLRIPEKKKIDVRVGDSFTFEGLEVQVLPAIHPQSEYPVGYIIRGGGTSIYHAGDTYKFDEMRSINVDVAILPVGGSYTMDVFTASDVCKSINARYMIPVHYDTFDKIAQDVSDICVGRGKVVVMHPGTVVKIK